MIKEEIENSKRLDAEYVWHHFCNPREYKENQLILKNAKGSKFYDVYGKEKKHNYFESTDFTGYVLNNTMEHLSVFKITAKVFFGDLRILSLGNWHVSDREILTCAQTC